MKGSNARFSHRPSKRYSNSAHVQGGMVTESDLSEAGQLHQARDEAQNSVTCLSGTPAQGGAVRITEQGPALSEGWIIAEGKQGWFASASGTLGADPLALFTDQADLPLGPSLPATPTLLYADLWERPVFSMQDTYLADAGLHGAETSYRTRTMTQIKAMVLDGGVGTLDSVLDDLHNGGQAFARTGTALATLTPKNTEIAVDECDPCADLVHIVPTIPNALFRLEVITVTRDGAGNPTSAQFAWSMENASAIEVTEGLDDGSTRDTFARANAAYEFFSDATEAQIGHFGSEHNTQRPMFANTLHPAPAPEAGANGDVPYSHVRRWDGAAVANLADRSIQNPLGSGKLTTSGGVVSLTLDAFSLQLDVQDKALLPGDYWLVELRRYALESERIYLVGSTNNDQAPSLGIYHYFCPLFLVENGQPKALSDTDTRRLNFPPLSNIPATHIGFEPACPDFYGQTENVADALNKLCELDADDVAYEPSDDCERFSGVKSVKEALERLCTVQDDTALTRILRLMMDWGVVCGVDLSLPKRNDSKIEWTNGTLLDRSGRLIDIGAGQFDLAQLPEQNIHGDLPEIMKVEGQICVSFAANKEGALELHLSDSKTAFGPADPLRSEAAQACIDGRKGIDFGKILRPLKPEEGKLVGEVINVWANRKTLEGAVPLSDTNGKIVSAVNKTLLDDYVATVEPSRGAQVINLIKLAEQELNPSALRGIARDHRRMQLEATKLGIIANSEAEDRRACECLNVLPPCPPELGEAPYLVPVGCVTMEPAGNKPAQISEVCPLCCRKQAITWRSHRYYFGSHLDDELADKRGQCCGTRKQPGTDIGKWIDEWDRDLFEPKPIPLPRPIPEPHPLWPPRWDPYELDPRVTDPRIYDPKIGLDEAGKLINLKPDVIRLPPSLAKDVLIGNGFDVIRTIDLDDTNNPLADLESLGTRVDAVLGRSSPKPGDKVVMLARNGKIVDFLAIEKGSGKLPYETDSQIKVRVENVIANIDVSQLIGGGQSGTSPLKPPTLPTGDLDVFERRLEDLLEQKLTTEAQVTQLIGQKQNLADELGTLKITLQRLGEQRGALAADLQQSKNDLDAIDIQKAENNQIISEARSELNSIKKAHNDFIVTVRQEQPVDVILRDNPNAARILRDQGILTIGDLQKQRTTDLSTLLKNTGLNGSKIKKLATDLIER